MTSSGDRAKIETKMDERGKMLAILVGAILLAAVAAGIALILNLLWPEAPVMRLAVIAALICPSVLTALLILAGNQASGPPNPDNIDSGMARAIVTVIGPIVVVLSFCCGLPASMETLLRIRRK
jgi:hypothetical protein